MRTPSFSLPNSYATSRSRSFYSQTLPRLASVVVVVVVAIAGGVAVTLIKPILNKQIPSSKAIHFGPPRLIMCTKSHIT